jgi:hypothetical protein
VAAGACVLCTIAGHYANRYSIINIIIYKKKMSIISLVNVVQVYLKKKKKKKKKKKRKKGF